MTAITPHVPADLSYWSLPFAYNTPNLTQGIAMVSAQTGDILIDAWLEIHTAWNGTTPTGDFGFFDTSPVGLLAGLNVPADMTQADSLDLWAFTLLAGSINGPPTGLTACVQVYMNALGWPKAIRALPARFVAPGIFGVVVSQNGQKGGASPGATQGSATLHAIFARSLSQLAPR